MLASAWICSNTNFEAILVAFNFTPEELVRYQAFLRYQQSAGQSEGPTSGSASQSTTSALSNSIPSSESVQASSHAPAPSVNLPLAHSQVPILSSNSGAASHILGVATPQSLPFHGSQQQSSQTYSHPQPLGPLPSHSQQQSSQAYSHPQSLVPLPSHLQQIPPQAVPSITQLYQNTRAQQHGHPAAAAPSAPSFHPFFGTGLNISTSHVNQARLASASATIPRNPPLNRRRRGPSATAPTLPRVSSRMTIEKCMQEGAEVPSIRMTIRVFPPLVGLSFFRLHIFTHSKNTSVAIRETRAYHVQSSSHHC
jgi:hypothetical protein